MIIVIDDERTFDIDPAANIWYARNSSEGIALISKAWTNYITNYGEVIEAIYLDHDLGDDDTIRPVVDFLHCMGKLTEAFTSCIGDIFIHSQNPTTDWIVPLLGMAGYSHVERIPLPVLVKSESDQAWDDYYAAQETS